MESGGGPQMARWQDLDTFTLWHRNFVFTLLFILTTTITLSLILLHTTPASQF